MHLVDQNAQSPPIHFFSMSLVQNHFRSDVFRSSTDCEGSAFSQDLSKAKVSKPQIAVFVDQQVFRFEVSEDDVLGVKLLEGQGDGSCVESSLFSWESLD